MSSGIEAGALPEWINLGALATPEEITKRQMLAARGMELLPALATWIGEAAPLAERPPLLEVVGDTRQQIYSHMGIVGLAEAVDRFRELVAVFEASGSELDTRVSELRGVDDRSKAPADDDLFSGDAQASGPTGDGDPVGVGAEGARTGRWRNRP